MDYFDLYPKPRALRSGNDVTLLETIGTERRGARLVLARRRLGSEELWSMTAGALPAPDLGLRCKTAGAFDTPGNCQPGDAKFAAVVHADCGPYDTDLGRAVLSPEVCALILRINEATEAVELTDQGLTVFGSVDPLALLDECGDAAADVVLAIRDSLATLPAPSALRALGLDAAMREAATEHGLRAHTHPLRIGGALGEDDLALAVFANPSRGPDGAMREPGCFVALRFSEPLGVGLRLCAAVWRDRVENALFMHDLRVGDRAFDDAWRIEARRKEEARALFTEPARAALTELVELGASLVLDDKGLDARFPLPFTAKQFRRTLALLADLRGDLRGQRRPATPYR